MNKIKMFHSILMLFAITCMASMTNTAVAETGPVAAYSFDEGSGNTAEDASDNHNPATLTATSWITGKNGTALNFSASGAKAVINDNLTLVPADLTIEAWIKNDSNTVQDSIVFKGGIQGPYGTTFLHDQRRSLLVMGRWRRLQQHQRRRHSARHLVSRCGQFQRLRQ